MAFFFVLSVSNFACFRSLPLPAHPQRGVVMALLRPSHARGGVCRDPDLARSHRHHDRGILAEIAGGGTADGAYLGWVGFASVLNWGVWRLNG